MSSDIESLGRFEKGWKETQSGGLKEEAERLARTKKLITKNS